MWTEPKLCMGGVILPEKRTLPCEGMEFWVRLGAGLGAFTAVLLVSLTCYFWKKNKRYHSRFLPTHFSFSPSLSFFLFSLLLLLLLSSIPSSSFLTPCLPPHHPSFLLSSQLFFLSPYSLSLALFFLHVYLIIFFSSFYLLPSLFPFFILFVLFLPVFFLNFIYSYRISLLLSLLPLFLLFLLLSFLPFFLLSFFPTCPTFPPSLLPVFLLTVLPSFLLSSFLPTPYPHLFPSFPTSFLPFLLCLFLSSSLPLFDLIPSAVLSLSLHSSCQYSCGQHYSSSVFFTPTKLILSLVSLLGWSTSTPGW